MQAALKGVPYLSINKALHERIGVARLRALHAIDRVGEVGADGVEKRLCGRVIGRPAAAGQSPHCAPRAPCRRGRGRTAAS
jgi:hypothetical protein